MQKKLAIAIAVTFIAAALAAGPGAAVVDDTLDELDIPGQVEYTQEQLMAMGFNDWIVGFSELPMDRTQYAGHPVVQVIEGINVLVVEALEPVTLHAHALLDNNVRYVEYDDPTYAHLLYTPNDPLHTHSALWGTHRVGAEAAWDVTLGSSAVKIAVVDSGLNKGHEEFAGQSRVLDGWNFHGGNSDTGENNGCNHHGTHVSGTLGATIDNGVGIAGLSQSSILPVKIFGSGFFGCSAASVSNIANALMFAGDQGAHISQNSWGGGGSSSTLNNAIAYAHNLGTTHVASAGNSGPCSNCVDLPWRENANIVNIVSSIDNGDGFSSFSSQGPQVTVTAPGGGVGSSTSGTSDYHIMSGTSMAAPHVSGALALYIAANGNVGFNELQNVLTSTAEDLGHSSDRQGAGLVRADLMLGQGGGSPPDPDPEGPTASFTFSCADLDCDFDGSGSSAGDESITSYEWDFGDGNTGSGASVSHSYSSGGTYTVTLTVTDAGGLSDSTSDSVSVSEPGEPDPPADDTMHVNDISFSEGNGRPANRDVFTHININDGNGNNLEGVEVCIDVERHSDGATASGCGETGSNGSVTLVWENAGRGTYTACVTSLTLDGYTWASENDSASGGSCHTGSSQG
jgi:subtilisin family serine protease